MILLLACVAKPPLPLRPSAPLGPRASVEVLGIWDGILNTPSGPAPLRCTITHDGASLSIAGSTVPAAYTQVGSALEVRVPPVGVRLTGTLESDTWWATWSQGSLQVPIELHRQ